MSRRRYTVLHTFTSPFTEIGTEKTINNDVAVDRTGGVVGIPSTSHGLATGTWIWLYGTVAYDGYYQVLAASTTHEIRITKTYVAETFAGTEVARVLSFGAMASYSQGQDVTFEVAQHNANFTETTSGQSKSYGVPLFTLMQPTGIPMDATGGAGLFKIDVSSNVILVKGESCSNTTKTDIGVFQFTLPQAFVPGKKLAVSINTKLYTAGAPTDGGSTIDVSAYKQTGAGAVGSDLCLTAAQTYAALSTWYDKAFEIDGSGLAAGDVVEVKITGIAIESATVAMVLYIGGISVLLYL